MKVFYLLKQGLLVLFFLTVLKVQAQTGVISGKVLDETGLPLPGASVFIKGTTKVTLTDNNGLFRFTGLTSEEVILQIRSMGYKTLERSLKTAGNSNVTLTLESDNQMLDDVVIVGYGTQTRREVTGSIAKVSGDKIAALPTPSFEASLQGRAAGVQVTQGSGLAGSGSVIRIRGVGSISAGGDPLYVVDGIPVTADPFLNGNRGGMNQNPLATLNAEDIESVEILKDAGAAGIYGSRGANGVILVTTKRGKLGKPTFSLSTKFGLSTYANKPDFVSGPEWLTLRQEAWTNDGNTGLAPLPQGLTWAQASQNNTDWFDLVTETGKLNEQNISFSQGTDKIRTYVSANYSDLQSFLKGNSYGKYGARVNLDVKPTSYFSTSINIGYSKGTNTRVSAAWSGGIGDAMSTALPIYPVYNADGSFWTNGANPMRTINYMNWKSIDERLLAGITFELKPFKNFALKAIANMDNLQVTEDQFSPRELTGNANGFANRWDNKILNRNVTGTATYDIYLGKEHKINLIAGAESQAYQQNGYPNGISGEANEPYAKNLDAMYLRMQQLAGQNGLYYVNGLNRTTFASLFGRANYSYANKYYLQVLARRDGSSKFGPNRKYGFFPAISGAWTVSEENFLKNNKVISNLKLKASYGITGNANIPPGEYYAKFGNSGSYNGQVAVSPQNVENPDLHWEELKSIDLALEFGLFKGRISGEFAYYRKNTTDVLINGGISPSTGFGTAYQNVGEILNEGLELSLNTINIQSKNFKWTTNFNISKNYNEVVSIGSLSADAIGGGTNDTRIILGKPVGTNYLVRFHGVDPADGLPIWLDKDGYQTKTFSLDNRVAVGKVIPDYVGGLTNTFSFRGFELTSLFTFAIGGNIYDGSAKRQLGIVTDWNIRTDIADRWQKPGDIAKFPRLTMSTNTYPGLSSEWNYNSTMFLYDASFMRLRELTLAYNLPSSFTKKIGLSKTRIFATGMNLLTFTKYPGGDPEIARDFDTPQDRNMSPNVTYLTTPQQKSVLIGLSTSF
ncbi:TonB-dependent receptor [Pedobacter sp. ASV28]|uniref:SusC/RagA family TonB-linked outer membrane protein n=1 Tax=Pedobacter sp. ASV28 TaxID=2795123 RepID=UPI0018EBCF66|nr:TonB-dependent receptor [Pedobacter sp. ASV28]